MTDTMGAIRAAADSLESLAEHHEREAREMRDLASRLRRHESATETQTANFTQVAAPSTGPSKKNCIYPGCPKGRICQCLCKRHYGNYGYARKKDRGLTAKRWLKRMAGGQDGSGA